MKLNIARWGLFLTLGIVAIQCKTAPELPGVSEAVPESSIQTGGVLAERINGFMPSAERADNAAIVPDGLSGLTEEFEKTAALGSEISADLMLKWGQMKEQVMEHFEELSAESLAEWIKLNDALLKYSGDVCFADELEAVFYNSPMSEALTAEALKSVCYTRRYDRIYLNIYQNSILDFEHTTGGHVRLIQDTTYPHDGKISLQFEMEDTRYVDLYVRIPAWAEMAAVTAKGVKYPVHPGEFTEIGTKWKNGDRVEVVLGMQPKVWQGNSRFTFTFGPLILTHVLNSLALPFTGEEPLQYLKLVSPPGKMPTFTFNGVENQTLVLQPYYAEAEGGVRTAWIGRK